MMTSTDLDQRNPNPQAAPQPLETAISGSFIVCHSHYAIAFGTALL
jgi:hypothetical protein